MERGRFTIRYLDLVIFFSIFPFFKPMLIPANVQIMFKILFVSISLIYVCSHLGIKNLLNSSLILVIPIALSGIVNFFSGYLSLLNMFNGILFSIGLFCGYSIFEYCYYTGYQYDAFLTVYKILKVYSIISVVSIIIQGVDSNSYFFGSKFPTSYLLILFITFYFIKNQDRIQSNVTVLIKYCILSLFVFVIVWMIGCRTASVAFVIFFVLSFVTKGIRRILIKPQVIIIALIASAALIFVIGEILKTGLAQQILEVLGKDANMSDRLRYYERIPLILASGNKFWGYGYASDFLKSKILYGSNVQNGILQYLVEFGLFGVGALLVFVFVSVRGKERYNWGYFMFLYAMIITAIVEISISDAFFLGLFALKWLYFDNKFDYLESEYYG